MPEPDVKVEVEDCSEIEGHQVATNDEVQGNLTFLNESCISGLVKTDRSWWSFFRLVKSPEVHVSPFLSRPVRLTSGTMVAAPASNFNQTLDMAFLESAGGSLNFANKLRGYAGIRATWCFRVNISTTPFVSGRLRMTHMPFADNLQNTIEPIPKAYTRQWPGVEVDVNVQTSGIFKIPHRHVLPYFRLFDSTESENNGQFQLRTYMGPDFTAPSVAPDYEVWFWLEDVELVGIKADTADLVLATPSSGSMKTKIPTSGGEQTGSKPISSFLSAAAKLGDWGSTMIPAISPYVTPLSWVARVGAKLASALGYSRPINQNLPKEVKLKEWGYNSNATGVSTAYNTAVQHDGQVATAPYFGDVEDCMSLDFLVQQMHYMAQLVLGTQASGALIARGTLNPMALYTSPDARFISVFERNALFFSPFPSVWPSAAMTAAQYFGAWRGGFKIRLVFSKTKFHTGRLMFGYDYNPVVLGTVDSNVVPSYSSTVYNHRQILDLREGNEFEIEIPYFCVNPFVSMGTSIGSWYLYVVDPLKYAGQVTSTIPYVVEMAMTPGTTFNAPRDTGFVGDDAYVGAVVASSGSMETKKPVDLLAVTFGDDVSSLKQLAMRPHPRVAGTSGHWWSVFTGRTAGVFNFPANWGPLDTMRRIYAAEKGALNDIHAPTSDANLLSFSNFTYLPADTLTTRYQGGTSVYYARNNEFHSFTTQRYSPLGATYNVLGGPPVTDPLSPPAYLRYLNIRGTETNTFLTSAADDYSAMVFKGTMPIVPRNLASYKTF